ncbi:MerR family transcriptional regulator [Phascolarctobacterium succinatutens]|uniref:MerR family transcriptional regulator n=1 Tax=Phascolarctobacterium succinatutens TaxID=626940 RepID=UPI0023F28647|nr:MerR family transcriptional regulator [Phascolarctobacterium succinatutens]
MSKNPKLYYTAGELADLFELPKQTLLYYDKMGVLSPEFISENNYRHYSLKQYLLLEIILNMRKLGIPISKIKEYLVERSIDSLQALLQAKDRECEEIIAHNEKIRKNIHVFFSSWIKSAKAGLIR